jgi:hypothetical protein
MSYLNKQYISPSGTDFTEWILTEHDAAIFEEMSALEEQCRDVPVKDCIEKVVKALNLGRDLQGISARVNYIGTPRNPQLN